MYNTISFKKKMLATAVASVAAGMSGIVLAQQDTQLEEVMVTGIRASVIQSMDTKRNAVGVVDAISAEDIGKFPDKNVAESLQRIPGITIQRQFGEGAGVSIRGSGQDLTLTTLNGQNVASTGWFVLEPARRSFNYELLPSELVGNLEVYKASQAGVPIQLIVRGICCIRPGRKGLSDNIKVRSIVGDFLEHTRVYYFHNNGSPRVYGGSADVMVRSFDRRIESLFELVTNQVRQQAIHILQCNLRDNVYTYEMQEDGSYKHLANPEDLGIEPFDIHKVFFNAKLEDVMKARLFAGTVEPEHIELESI